MARKTKIDENDSGALITAAKAVGSAAGKIASMVGAGAPNPAPAARAGKLPKKNKQRLPRRQKKAMRRARNAPAASL